jgi:glycosyltransferase involved in cell wall biosynthesis
MNKRIKHLSFSLSGGAGVVAKRLALFQKGLDGYSSEIHTVIERDLKSQPTKNSKLTYAAMGDKYVIKKTNFKPLISLMRENESFLPESIFSEKNFNLHLHWTSGMINPSKLEEISKRVPMIVWTMHDFAPLTGCCHFPLECDNYLRNCTACPAVRSLFRNKVEKLKIQKTRNIENIQNLKVVFPSRWMQDKFYKMGISTKNPTSVIYNPISDVFYDKSILGSRHILGIEEESYVVGFVSSQIDNPLKRIDEYLRVISRVSVQTGRQIVALIAGNGRLKFNNPGNIRVVRVKNNYDEKQMVSLYKTFDILLSTSSSESFGLGIAEALATGTKSIAYNNSTASELIDDKVSGYIVEDTDQAVQVILQEMRQFNLKKRTTFNNATQFNIKTVCKKYDELYINGA